MFYCRPHDDMFDVRMKRNGEDTLIAVCATEPAATMIATSLNHSFDTLKRAGLSVEDEDGTPRATPKGQQILDSIRQYPNN